MCVCLTLGSYLIKKPVGKSLRTALIGRKHGFDSINRHSCTLHYFAATHAPLGSSSLPATRVPAPSAPATEQESPSFAHSILSPGTPLHTLGQEVKITCQGASRSSCTRLQCLARAVRLYSRDNTAAAAPQMPTPRAWPLPGRRLSFSDGTLLGSTVPHRRPSASARSINEPGRRSSPRLVRVDRGRILHA